MNYYAQILSVLTELKELFPRYNLGRHLETALDGRKDMWGLTDKEMLDAVNVYKQKLTIDTPHRDDSELAKIIKDGMQLHNILHEDEEDD
jgi:hypothetical protein